MRGRVFPRAIILLFTSINFVASQTPTLTPAVGSASQHLQDRKGVLKACQLPSLQLSCSSLHRPIGHITTPINSGTGLNRSGRLSVFGACGTYIAMFSKTKVFTVQSLLIGDAASIRARTDQTWSLMLGALTAVRH